MRTEEGEEDIEAGEGANPGSEKKISEHQTDEAVKLGDLQTAIDIKEDSASTGNMREYGGKERFRILFTQTSNFFKGRYNRKTRYPPEVKRLLFKNQVYSILIASIGIKAFSMAFKLYEYGENTIVDLKPDPPEFKMILGSFICNLVGIMLKNNFPELAVVAMIGSTGLAVAIVTLAFAVSGGDVVRILIPLIIFICFFPMFRQLYVMDVREPANEEVDNNIE